MFFYSRHHSPKKIIRIRNFKKIIFFSWNLVLWGSNEGHNFHSIAFLGISKSSRKIFFANIMLQWLVSSYKQKTKQKKRVISPQHLKNWKSWFSLISGSIKLVPGPKFSLWVNFSVWQNRAEKYFLLLHCSIGLPHHTQKKTKHQKLLISWQTTF